MIWEKKDLGLSLRPQRMKLKGREIGITERLGHGLSLLLHN